MGHCCSYKVVYDADSMIENLRSLAILTTVVEEGSYRAAGEKLGLSASVVSHHMTNLEKRLDCPIFLRVARQLRLTPKGEILHKAAREMVDVIGIGLKAISLDEIDTGGVLRMAVPQVLMQGGVLRAMEGFLISHPHINLQLEQCHPELDPLLDGYSLVFSRKIPNTKALEWKRLTDIEFGFFAAPDLAVKLGDCIRQHGIERIPFIRAPGYDAEEWLAALTLAIGPEAAKYSFRLECDDLSVAHRITCSGGGVAALPVLLANADTNTGRLVRVFEEIQIPARVYYAIYPQNGTQETMASRFLEHLLMEQVLEVAVL